MVELESEGTIYSGQDGLFIIHSNWLIKGLECFSTIRAQGESNHRPIVLHLEKTKNLGPFPFRFNAYWVQAKGVAELVKQAWYLPIQGSPMFTWESNLKNVKQTLRKWLKDTCQPPSQKSKQLEEHYRSIEEVKVEERHMQKEKELTHQLFSVSRQEENLW